MEDTQLTSIPGDSTLITEADLHAYVDRQLSPARHAEVELFLSARPDERQRVHDWQMQNEMLREVLDPVLDEPLPRRLPIKAPTREHSWQAIAAAVLVAVASAGSAWVARGSVDADAARVALASSPRLALSTSEDLNGFALRAAVAHVVYTPDVRRPVEVGADQEQQLVGWLSKRLGAQIKPPSLQDAGYELMGGRLLPGDAGPVAQFMYQDPSGRRLTLYVTREVPRDAGVPQTAFRFGKDGPINVFYWVDKNFGYAISGSADRQELMRVSQEVYRKLAPI